MTPALTAVAPGTAALILFGVFFGLMFLRVPVAVAPDQKLAAVALLLHHYRPVSTLAFCNTRQQCRDLLQVLRAEGFVAMALHGEMEQRERDQVLIQFSNRSCSVLVAT